MFKIVDQYVMKRLRGNASICTKLLQKRLEIGQYIFPIGDTSQELRYTLTIKTHEERKRDLRWIGKEGRKH
jgi:hypothetical protein